MSAPPHGSGVPCSPLKWPRRRRLWRHSSKDTSACNTAKTDDFIDWVENHSFGADYPRHRLPISACEVAHAAASKETRSSEELSSLLCTACDQVIDVSIRRGSCIPSNAPGFEVLQPGSLQERCLYLADVIGVTAEELLSEFKQSVCSCLGCCGDRRCYFPSSEESWIRHLISDVKTRLMKDYDIR